MEGPPYDLDLGFMPEKLTKDQGMTMVVSKALESRPWEPSSEEPGVETRTASANLENGVATLIQKRAIGELDISSTIELKDWVDTGPIVLRPGEAKRLEWSMEGRSLSEDPDFLTLAGVYLRAIQGVSDHLEGNSSEEID